MQLTHGNKMSLRHLSDNRSLRDKGSITMIRARRTVRFLLLALGGLALAWFSLMSPVPTLWAATSYTIPLQFIRSADCTDELVEISGTIHLITQTQADGSVVGVFNYQGVTGVGLTSGSRYQVSAVDQVRLRAPFPSSITSTSSFHLISRGSASNLLVTVLYHITINGSGEATVSIDTMNMQCT
jgi:hypothetical protein